MSEWLTVVRDAAELVVGPDDGTGVERVSDGAVAAIEGEVMHDRGRRRRRVAGPGGWQS